MLRIRQYQVPTHVIRGLTELSDIATIIWPLPTYPRPNPTGPRIATVEIRINNIVTSSDAITEVFAHEIGHTFGLGDCNRCGLHSSVMEALDPSDVNGLIGLPGPTGNDIHFIVQVTGGHDPTLGGEYTCCGWRRDVNGLCSPA